MKKTGPAFWFSFFFLIALPAYAEQKNESEIPVRETRASLLTSETADEAFEKYRFIRVEKVSFRDIYADPDNVKLNLQYAKEQIKEGHFLPAAAALERVLMVRPELSQVRAFYAMVLFRVGNHIEAEQEFNLVLKQKISGPLRLEVVEYLNKIKRGKRKTNFTLRQSVGFGMDSNRNASPSSKQNLVGDVIVPLSHQNGKQPDTNFTNITGLDVVQDLGFQTGHKLLASFNYYLAEQTIVDSLDLASYQGQIGPAIKTRFLNVRPSFSFGHTLLSKETFLRTFGGAIGVDRVFLKRLKPFAVMRLEHQDFQSVAESPSVHERRGDQLRITLGNIYRLNRTMNISIGYTLTDKDAKEEYKAYMGHDANLTYSWILPKGQFLTNSVTLSRDNYEAPELALSGMHRRDKTIQTRTVYGAPLSFYIDEPISWMRGKGVLPGILQDFVISFTYEYLRELSNLTNYTYSNHKYSMMISKRLEF